MNGNDWRLFAGTPFAEWDMCITHSFEAEPSVYSSGLNRFCIRLSFCDHIWIETGLVRAPARPAGDGQALGI